MKYFVLFLLALTGPASAQVYNYFPPPGLSYDGTNHTLTSNQPVGILKPGFSVNGDSTSAPIYELIDNSSAANNKRWWWLASGVLGMYAVDDAGNPGQSGIQINRSGTNITQSGLLAGSKNITIKSTGDVQINASVGLSGQPIISGGPGANAAYGAVDLSNTNAVSNILSLANIVTCATNQVLFASSSTTAACSSALTWINSTQTALMGGGTSTTAGKLNGLGTLRMYGLSDTGSDTDGTAQILGGGCLTGGGCTGGPFKGVSLILGDGSGLGTIFGTNQVACKYAWSGDMYCAGSANPIWEFRNTASGNAAFNTFQVSNDAGNANVSPGFSVTADNATQCGPQFGYAYSAIAHACYAITSGGNPGDHYPLLLDLDFTYEAALFQFNQHQFFVGAVALQYLQATNPAGTAVNVTLGDSSLANSVTNIKGGSGSNTQINGSPACSNSTGCPATTIKLTGTSGSIGGALLVAGGCSSGTVTITGATTGMSSVASPAGGTNPDPGTLGVFWRSRVSAANTVTVDVCTVVAGTPTAATYNTRVLQ